MYPWSSADFTIRDTVARALFSSREICLMPLPEMNFFTIRSRCGAGMRDWVPLVAFGMAVADAMFSDFSRNLGPNALRSWPNLLRVTVGLVQGTLKFGDTGVVGGPVPKTLASPAIRFVRKPLQERPRILFKTSG